MTSGILSHKTKWDGVPLPDAMCPTVEVDAAEIERRKADDKGRVYLGPDVADREVTVAIVDVEDDDEDVAEQSAN